MTRQQRHELFAAVFGTQEGREVLEEILAYAGMGKGVYVRESDRQTAFLAGRQDVAIWLAGTVFGDEEQ